MNSEHLAARKSDLRDQAQAARLKAAQFAPGAARLAAARALPAILRNGTPKVASAYMAIRNEIDPLPLMHLLHGLEITVALPVIAEPGRPLGFRRWSPGMRMVRGVHGLPVPEDGEVVEPEVLIVPLLAFDRRGHRLGYGGGYYDRTIAELRERRPILAIGFAFAAQEVADLPSGLHDMPLDAVATERGVIFPEGAASPEAAR